MPIDLKSPIKDDDLKILGEMSDQELSVLVKIIVDKGNMTQRLTSKKEYKRLYPDHQKYADLIADELIAFGSHTFYFNKRYKEIVRDVCDKMDVPYDKTHGLRRLEQNLLSKVLEQTWENMSEEEKRDLLDSVGENDLAVSNASSAVLLGLFQAGGTTSMQLALSIVGSIAELIIGGSVEAFAVAGGTALVGSGGAFAASVMAGRVFAILTGPIGIALTTALTLKSLGGPAYRVTVPAVIYIAGMRMLHSHQPSVGNQAPVEQSTRSKTPISLKRNRKKPKLLPERIMIGFNRVEGYDIDAVTFLLGLDGRVTSDADFIFYNQTEHVTGAVKLMEDANLIRIDLTRTSSNVQSIKIFLVTEEGNFARMSGMFVRVFDADDMSEIFKSDLDGDFTTAKSIEVGEIIRRGDGWTFDCVRRGGTEELITLCGRFGVNAE